jgi:hypothetical protein
MSQQNNSGQLNGVVIILLALFGIVQLKGTLPNFAELVVKTFARQPSVSAPTSDAPDLLAVFVTNSDRKEAKQHAYVTAEMLAGLKRGLEQDRAKAEGDRVLKLNGHIESVRTQYRAFVVLGFQYQVKYPDVGGKGFVEVMSKFLDERKLGKWEDPLTDETRSRWIDAYGKAEAAARWAHANL